MTFTTYLGIPKELKPTVILASKEQRKLDILVNNVGVDRGVVASRDTFTAREDDSLGIELAKKSAEEVVSEIAYQRGFKEASDVLLPGSTDLLISSETVLESHCGQILRKARNNTQLLEFYDILQDKRHRVLTGVWIFTCYQGHLEAFYFVECTWVKFSELTKTDIATISRYSEVYENVGGFNYTGPSGQFIESIQGCAFNISGIPAHSVSRGLAVVASRNLTGEDKSKYFSAYRSLASKVY